LDFDTTGSEDLHEDARIIACALEAIRSIGVGEAVMLINDRNNFENVPIDVIRAIDKLHKIGEEGIKEELLSKNLALDEIENHLFKIKNSKPTESLNKIFKVLSEKYSLIEGSDFAFDSTLARGLDYYTGAIFELKPNDDPVLLSVGSGGRYDNLIGMFSEKEIPAVGFSFGVDRLLEILP
jgi:histidyl-tRNA synthetase